MFNFMPVVLPERAVDPLLKASRRIAAALPCSAEDVYHALLRRRQDAESVGRTFDLAIASEDVRTEFVEMSRRGAFGGY